MTCHGISFNNNVDFEKHIMKYPDKPWDWHWISRKPNIDFEKHVLKYIDQPWNWFWICFSLDLTKYYHYFENKNIPWCSLGLCSNKHFDFEKHILKYFSDIQFNSTEWYFISMSQYTDFEKHVMKYPDLPWHWQGLSSNHSIDFEKHVLKYIEKPWDWYSLSCNKNIDLDHHVLKHLDKPWLLELIVYYKMSYNKIRSFQDIIAPRPLNWEVICISEWFLSVDVHDNDYIEFVHKTIKINKIKRKWFESISNPTYKICKKRLRSEYENLQNSNI